ncbi:MAG: glutamyl-tRNA reductase [Gemmatimonadales bacterium]|jgi:glutamyl-tRNA reductase
MGRLLAFGTSHAVAPARLRDGLYMDEESVVALLQRLRGTASISEIALLHTCTRLEVYALVDDVEAAEEAVVELLAGGDADRGAEIREHSYALTGDAAARHLFRVAAGLDSIVLGEPQILGQVREAARLAGSVNATGPILRRLFATAVRAGKRTRSETGLARGPTSLAAAGVRLALQASDDFPSQTVLVVGAGETARLTARHLAKRGPGRLVIANRSPAPARQLADELGAETAGLEDIGALAAEATVIVTAVSAERPVLRADQLASAMQSRPERPLVVVDLGRPRNVEAPEPTIPNLAVHDLDGLAETVSENRNRQTAAIPRVEAIVVEELERFSRWRRGRDVLPHVRALRRHFFEVGQREIASQEGNFDAQQREALRAYTRSLIAKLLHEPTVRIKQTDSDTVEGNARLDAVQALFDLDV